jgi:hypothetical protein
MSGQTVVDTRTMCVGPVMTGLDLLSVLPGTPPEPVKEFQGHDAVALDPYEDQFDLEKSQGSWPWDPTQEKDNWYGMQINYDLHGNVTDLRFRFNDAGDGDMGDEHRLLVPQDYTLGGALPFPILAIHHQGKWEGFDGTITDEDISQVYMRDVEAEKIGSSGPPSGQTLRGIATWNIVKAATYRLNVDMVLGSDSSQEQHFQVDFDVSY